MRIMGHECSVEDAEWFASGESEGQEASHPNQYPGKTFVPWEGDMPVETTELPRDFSPRREGIAGVSPEERDAIPARSILKDEVEIEPTGEQ